MSARDTELIKLHMGKEKRQTNIGETIVSANSRNKRRRQNCRAAESLRDDEEIEAPIRHACVPYGVDEYGWTEGHDDAAAQCIAVEHTKLPHIPAGCHG